MVKLLACDVDGTLLPQGENAISGRVFAAIRGLAQKRVLFAVASGRAWHELKRLFAPVEEDVLFLCYDGALALRQGRALAGWPMDSGLTAELAGFAAERLGCHVVCGGRGISYFLTRSEAFAAEIREKYRHHVQRLDSPAELPNTVYKLALYRPGNTPGPAELKPLRKDKFSCVYQGEGWLELVAKGVGKDAALRFLQKKFSVPRVYTGAIGDSLNDLAMLRAAGESWAVRGGRPEVKQICRHITPEAVETLEALAGLENSNKRK